MLTLRAEWGKKRGKIGRKKLKSGGKDREIAYQLLLWANQVQLNEKIIYCQLKYIG